MRKLICVFAVAMLFMGAGLSFGQTINQFPTGISTPKIYDYSTSSGWLDSYYLDIPTLTANDTFAGLTTTQTFTNKTLTVPVIASFYQDAGKTYLLTAPAVTGTLATLAGTEALTNKTLTSPVLNTPSIVITSASHDFNNATGTWTLSATEKTAQILYVYGATADGSLIIGPSEGRIYHVFNGSNIGVATGNITIRKTGGAGVVIATGKAAQVGYFVTSATTDYLRLTADASF